MTFSLRVMNLNTQR